MPLLGQGYRPELGVYDYSTINRANEMMGQATVNFGQQISGSLDDYFKGQADDKKKVKSGNAQIAAAMALFPDKKAYFEQIQHSLKDENNSISERAAIAESVSDMINMGVNQMRYSGEMLLKQQELATNERAANDAHNANRYTLAAAQTKDEANRIVNSSIGPAKLQAAIDMAKRVRPEILSAMPDVSAMAPDMQSQIADSIIQLLPPADKKKFVEKFPVMVDGVEGTLPAWVDETTGTASPVQMDGMVLPPKDGNDSTPEELAAATPNPAFIPTVPAADRELKGLQIEKARQEIGAGQTAATDKVNAAGASVAKSERMAGLLDQLDKHPGFSGLFGFGMGARKIPGTDAAGAETLFKQIDAMGFIEAIKDMKGMGALSNAEGEKVSAALVGMDPKMPEKEARAKIREIKNQIQIGIQRQKSGQLVNPDGTPKAATAQASPGSSDLLNAWQNRPR